MSGPAGDEQPEYRAFCAYGPHYLEPGCGWGATAETEARAEHLARAHSQGQSHAADYEAVSP